MVADWGTSLSDRRRLTAFIDRHFQAVSFLLFAAVVFISYWPSLFSYFISDDFQYIGFLFFAKPIFDSGVLNFWFIQGMDGGLYFRPVGHAFILVDYIIGGTNPLGYHLTNTIFHLLCSIEVFVLLRLVLRERSAAVIGGLLFAVLPVHAEAVSWIAARYDVIGGFFYLAGLIFFVLFRQRARLWFYVLSVVSFALALGSKETALSFPAVVLLYDLLFHWGETTFRERAICHLPFWLLLAARVYFLGHGYRGFQPVPEGIWYWFDWNVVNLLQPLAVSASSDLRWAVIGSAALLLVFYRFRKEIVWGVLSVPLMMLPTLTSGPSDRSLYIPSIGLAFVGSMVFASLAGSRNSLIRRATPAAFALIISVFISSLILRNQAYNQAGQVAAAIPAQVKSLHPTLPSDARLIFVGVPDQVPDGPLVYLTGFERSVQMTYQTTLQVFKFGAFPLWPGQLDRTFFFQVDHKRVTERADLLQAVVERERCSASSQTAISWDFAEDAQGWEPWNQLEGFESRDGALVTSSQGADPSMGSPPVDIPSMSIADFQVTMSVRANGLPLKGELYWLTAGQRDFSPGLRESFPVQADGDFHTYTIDLFKSNKLAIGDRIVQFRLDPVDGPAQIAIRSIRASVSCNPLEGEHCSCRP